MKSDRFFSLAVLVFTLFFFLLSRGDVSTAYAYPIGSSGPPLPPIVAPGSFNFDFNNSFANLIAPFESFFRSLENSIGTTAVVGGEPSPPPIFVSTSTFQSEFQNGPQVIDNWFYNLTRIHLSDIVSMIARSALWIRGSAQQFVQWVSEWLQTHK